MNHFPDYSKSPNGSAILLSVKPRFADLIVAGSKLVELRRAIPAQPVDAIVIYSSSPIQALVAIARVKEIVEATPSKLWTIANNNGGGVTKTELLAYFEGKKTGFALMLENIRIFEKPVSPKRIFKLFTPPQSFKYLTTKEFKELEILLEPRNKK
ncbi:ASCH domain protein [soil metagenome]